MEVGQKSLDISIAPEWGEVQWIPQEESLTGRAGGVPAQVQVQVTPLSPGIGCWQQM